MLVLKFSHYIFFDIWKFQIYKKKMIKSLYELACLKYLVSADYVPLSILLDKKKGLLYSLLPKYNESL